jgi:hypothetical protein
VAANYNKTWSSTLVQEVRVGMSYYHNEAVAEADGLNTSEEVGIRGVNLNRFSSGISTIDVAGYNGTLVGYSASLPWDRSERTWTVATTVTKLQGNHTVKIGGDLRYNGDFLLQVQDNGGRAASSVSAARRPPSPATRPRRTASPTRLRPSCSTRRRVSAET